MTQFLQNAVYGTALILAAALLRRVLKDKLAPGARLALWAACLFRLLTPAAPESVFSLWGLLGRGAQDAPVPAAPSVGAPGGAGAVVPAVPNAAAPAVPAPAPAGAGVPWEMILLGLWLAVGAVFAARYVLSYARTRREVGHAIPIGRDDPRYTPLPKCARLREGPMDGAPLTFGAVRPTVVLAPGLSGAELECVLAHEAVHARRRDNLWHYATALALTVFWWNPAVWLMARLLRRDVELSCDRAALKALGDGRRAEYANALVSMATAAEGPAFCQTFGRKAAEERILSIMKYKKMTIAGTALTLALVLAVTVGFASDPAADGKNGEAFYKDENGSLVKIDPDTVVNGFVSPGDGTIEFAGRVYTREELSQETLDWLDWYLALEEQEQLAISYVPAELNQGRDTETQDAGPTPVPVETTKDGMIAATGTKGETGYIRESDSLHGQFEALYGPVNTPEDASRYMEWLKTQPISYSIPLYDAQGKVIGEFAMTNPVGAGDAPICNLPLAPDGSGDAPIAYPICSLSDCGDTGVHTHNGVTYCGWTDKGTIPPYCTNESCTVNGAHYHENGDIRNEAHPCYPTAEGFAGMGDEPIACPPEAIDTSFGTASAVNPPCPIEGCTEVTAHQHDGCWYCFMHPVCSISGCTLTGEHFHDGVVYSCNGHGHQGGVCDGTCCTTTGLPAAAGPASTRTHHSSGTHHSETHHGNHHN